MRQFYFGLLFMVNCYGAIYAQSLQRPVSIETDLKEEFSDPLVSPDSQYALVCTLEKGGLYLLDLNTGKVQLISNNPASNYAYCWNDNSELFYYREVEEGKYLSQAKVFTYSIKKGKSFENRDDLRVEFLPSFRGLDDGSTEPVVVFVDAESFQIKAFDLLTRKEWFVTHDDQQQFYAPVLSNDKTKVAVHCNGILYVYAVDGKTPPVKVGEGLATQWSKDDNFILGFQDESEDGHAISNSDVYLFSPYGKEPIPLTRTKDRIEMSPVFVNENQIMYSDDSDGKLYTLNFNK